MLKRLLRYVFAWLGLVTVAHADPAAITAAKAPAAWIQYASLVETAFESRLSENSDEANRLNAYLQSGNPDGTVNIAVGVWVDADGVVSRIAFKPFLDSQANTDMNQLLQGIKLPAGPPQNILLPIHFVLHIKPAPQQSKLAHPSS